MISILVFRSAPAASKAALTRWRSAWPRAGQVIIDGFPGVLWEDFRARLAAALHARGVRVAWCDVSTALLPPHAHRRPDRPLPGRRRSDLWLPLRRRPPSLLRCRQAGGAGARSGRRPQYHLRLRRSACPGVVRGAGVRGRAQERDPVPPARRLGDMPWRRRPARPQARLQALLLCRLDGSQPPQGGALRPHRLDRGRPAARRDHLCLRAATCARASTAWPTTTSACAPGLSRGRGAGSGSGSACRSLPRMCPTTPGRLS